MLALRLSSIDDLQQPEKISQLHSLKSHMEKIATLYDGQLGIERPHSFTISFNDDNQQADFLIRALCCGLLISRWLQTQSDHNGIGLGLASVRLTADSKVSRATHNPLLRRQLIDQACNIAIESKQLAVSNTIASLEELEGFLVFADQQPHCDNSFIVSALSESYGELLESQLEVIIRGSF